MAQVQDEAKHEGENKAERRRRDVKCEERAPL